LVIYTWTPELKAAVEDAKAARPVCHGWKSMWQRFIDRALRETKVTERFTEHDQRAKCASDAESLEHARAMLAHADAKTTELIYRRRPERVRPAR
jgi:integrase